uniref:RNase H type-1 domain-containing protein n=1 Tax=Oryza rufipogon TaxID=4529 RepID=A0A0E0MTV9_ORYRU
MGSPAYGMDENQCRWILRRYLEYWWHRYSSALEAELLAIRDGIILAYQWTLRPCIVETDCLEAVHLLQMKGKILSDQVFLVREVCDLMTGDREILLRKVHHSVNSGSHFLANKARIPVPYATAINERTKHMHAKAKGGKDLQIADRADVEREAISSRCAEHPRCPAGGGHRDRGADPWCVCLPVPLPMQVAQKCQNPKKQADDAGDGGHR